MAHCSFCGAETALFDRGVPIFLKGEEQKGQRTKDILKKIDNRGQALLNSGEPWEDGMLDIPFSTEGVAPESCN